MTLITFMLNILIFSLFAGCASPVAEDRAWISPAGNSWVHIEQVPADANKDQLLPTQRLILKEHLSLSGLILLEDVETLCGIEVRWLDPTHVLIRVPGNKASVLRVRDQENWHGITVQVQLHDDLVQLQSWSSDGQRRLVVIRNCESGDWNLYLRRPDEPNYNVAMDTGWDDPDLFGGFAENQPFISLAWTGRRNAEIKVSGRQRWVTLKQQIGDVKVKWTFVESYVVPTPVTFLAPRIKSPYDRHNLSATATAPVNVKN